MSGVAEDGDVHVAGGHGRGGGRGRGRGRGRGSAASGRGRRGKASSTPTPKAQAKTTAKSKPAAGPPFWRCLFASLLPHLIPFPPTPTCHHMH
eukprot:2033957-Pyramimonas_sp.AAC.1